VAGEQPRIKRRLTIIELPVLRIVAQSLWLPFRYLPELAKYGGIPFLLSLGAKAINFLIVREDAPAYIPQIWMMTAHLALFTPFSVTWTKLAIYGREAIANDPPFAYSRTEWRYLLATIVMMLSIVIVAAPPIALLRYGQVNFDNQIVAVAGLLTVAALFLVALGFFRIAAFVFPAIAIVKYAGLSAAWKQTAGNLERIAAIVILSYLPYYIVRKILDRAIGYHPPGLKAAAAASLEMLLVALVTTGLAGSALAYKSIVLDEHEESPADSASSLGPH